MKKNIKLKSTIAFSVLLGLIIQLFTSCDPSIDGLSYDLPEANSKEDQTPPEASFVAAVTDDYLTYTFGNTSSSATDYVWDFGDGNSSTNVDGVNTYPGEGTYTVTLTAKDKLGVTSSVSQTIEVVEPDEPLVKVPTILEAGFEDLSLPDGTGDGRDSWRNSDLGGVIQITSSPVYEGKQASKYPSAGDRIAYQELEVSANADYKITYYYTLKTDNPGSITLAVLAGGGITDASTATVLGSFEGTDQTDDSAYVQATVSFNSGANTTVAIYISNQGVEARIDDISIEAVE